MSSAETICAWEIAFARFSCVGIATPAFSLRASLSSRVRGIHILGERDPDGCYL
ncbi:hypothetical protein HMPREF0044_0285 [Gleimia coleocanis DSM 15436]|uniref:Uncharacterized protein n=1 Tax=Gleimia coleocanis DSM 15436 TaxID=525245 RepID=C0VYP5_9ACTO|nr:hypothetical protein HMPREF0044_0285 [Gleimia coleocanis DSM 15436]